MRSTGLLYNQTGSEESNMAAFEPEVPISQLVRIKGTKFRTAGYSI